MCSPYTYLIGWSYHNKWYYGVRFSEKCHPDDLWVTYFTSSKIVADFREKHGNPDIIEIRKTFNDKNSARLWEHRVLKKMNVILRDDFLNNSDGISIPSQKGTIKGPMSYKHKYDMIQTKTKSNLISFFFNRKYKDFKYSKSKALLKKLNDYLNFLQNRTIKCKRMIHILENIIIECMKFERKQYTKNRKSSPRKQVAYKISNSRKGKFWYKSPCNTKCICVYEKNKPNGWKRGMIKSIKPIPPHLKKKDII